MKQVLKRYLPVALMALPLVVALVEPAYAQRRQNFFDLQLPVFFPTNPDGFFDVLRLVINFVLLVGGLLAFFYTLYGGFVYLTSGGDPAKASTGQKMIVNAIIGILIIFISFALVNFVVNRIDRGGTGSDSGVYSLAR